MHSGTSLGAFSDMYFHLHLVYISKSLNFMSLIVKRLSQARSTNMLDEHFGKKRGLMVFDL